MCMLWFHVRYILSQCQYVSSDENVIVLTYHRQCLWSVNSEILLSYF